MSGYGSDKLFAGSIPELYDTYLVPLIFEPYAADLAARLASRPLARVLEIAAGTGVAVLAVRPSGRIESGYELPDPDRPLGAGDSLVLAGTAEALRVAQAL